MDTQELQELRGELDELAFSEDESFEELSLRISFIQTKLLFSILKELKQMSVNQETLDNDLKALVTAIEDNAAAVQTETEAITNETATILSAWDAVKAANPAIDFTTEDSLITGAVAKVKTSTGNITTSTAAVGNMLPAAPAASATVP